MFEIGPSRIFEICHQLCKIAELKICLYVVAIRTSIKFITKSKINFAYQAHQICQSDLYLEKISLASVRYIFDFSSVSGAKFLRNCNDVLQRFHASEQELELLWTDREWQVSRPGHLPLLRWRRV